MMWRINSSNNIDAFFALLRSGLWEKDVLLSQYEPIDYKEVHRLAQEQSVVGLVAAGLEHVSDIKIPKDVALLFAGEALLLEHRNVAMNNFIGRLVDKLEEVHVFPLIVKGQGIAQCYERPLWRACGDVDFLLDDSNFFKAQKYLLAVCSSSEPLLKDEMHQEFVIDSWVVEIHGNMPTFFSKKTDAILEQIHNEAISNNKIKKWFNSGTIINLLNPDADVLFVFTHFLKHFFRGGIGLRQICDWCRLLWTNKEVINSSLLEKRLKAMGLMTEWKAFASLAVNELGCPLDCIPLYSNELRWTRKSAKIMDFILRTGNFGHNRDTSYYYKYPFIVTKVISFYWRFADNFRYLLIFPLDSVRVTIWMFRHGLSDLKRACQRDRLTMPEV